MLLIADSQQASFVDGLELAEQLREVFTTRDPVLLRAAASSLEAKASTSYEFGVACGFRIMAAEAQDFAAERAARFTWQLGDVAVLA